MEREISRNTTEDLLDMVRWWEKKRWIYNVIILLMTIVTLVVLWPEVGVSITKKGIIFDSFWMIIWSNVLYSTGWAGGILKRYYLGSYPLSNSGRWFLFIIGTIFTVFVLEIRLSILVNPMFVG